VVVACSARNGLLRRRFLLVSRPGQHLGRRRGPDAERRALVAGVRWTGTTSWGRGAVSGLRPVRGHFAPAEQASADPDSTSG
jgi:hypothetical protein